MKVLLTHPDKNYSIGSNNPAINTKWECEGVIVEKHEGTVDVSWSNGNRNVYKAGELSVVTDGAYIDIWQEIG